MVLVVVVGAFYIKAQNFSPVHPTHRDRRGGGRDRYRPVGVLAADRRGGSHYGWYGVLAGASIVFFAFIGFDIVATAAEETKNPQRDLPRGILASLAIVTVLYVAVSVVLSGMVHYTQLRDTGQGHANLPPPRSRAQRCQLGGQGHLHRCAGRADHRGHGHHAGSVPVLFAMSRDGLLPRPGLHRFARHAGADHGADRRRVAVAASLFPMAKLEEMVNVGTLFAFVLVSRRGHHPASHPPRPAAGLQGAVRALAASVVDRGLSG